MGNFLSTQCPNAFFLVMVRLQLRGVGCTTAWAHVLQPACRKQALLLAGYPLVLRVDGRIAPSNQTICSSSASDPLAAMRMRMHGACGSKPGRNLQHVRVQVIAIRA